MKVIQVLMLAIGGLLLGCTEEVDSGKLLDADNKVYIQSYISPSDTLISINVSRALSTFGTVFKKNDREEYIEKFIIKNAIVQLESESGLIITVPFVSEENKYQLTSSLFPIIEGNSYYLKVVVDDEQYTSSCSIPKKVNNPRYNLIKGVSEYDVKQDVLKIFFDDIAGENNFYVVGGDYSYAIDENKYINQVYFDENRFVTDAIGDGDVLSTSGDFYRNTGGEFDQESLLLQVANVEENLYQNLKATYSNQYNDGNPFAEYVIAPDNIEGKGGVGVFAGYNLTEEEIILINE
ncbi:hypothetical protein [Maribacter sp.]|uniref:DUF4249 family protein n=1 Tax=Maribacter sp. TaxID=1897614 RepID=UPI0025C624E5|nr:hypothetical protein [Maribacter sp.]